MRLRWSSVTFAAAFPARRCSSSTTTTRTSRASSRVSRARGAAWCAYCTSFMIFRSTASPDSRLGCMERTMSDATRDWEQEHASGKLDFLDRAHEQLRHAVIACMISQHAPGEVIDLGCGRGHQLAWLRPDDVTRYTGVDVSATA